MEDFTRASADRILEKARAVVNEALKDEGLSVTRAGGTYRGFLLDLKLTIEGKGEGGEIEASRIFKERATYYGLEVDMLGRTFTAPDGKTYTVAGLNPKRTKNSVIVTDPSGRQLITTPDNLRRQLAYDDIRSKS